MASFFNFFDLGIGGGSLFLGLVATLVFYQAVYLVTSIVIGIFLAIYVTYIMVNRRTAINSVEKEQISSNNL